MGIILADPLAQLNDVGARTVNIRDARHVGEPPVNGRAEGFRGSERPGQGASRQNLTMKANKVSTSWEVGPSPGPTSE